MVAVDVVVQRVQVRWSKQSRAFPGAAVRNALPSAFRLPSGHAPEFHDVVLDEDDGFAPQQTVSEPPRHTFGLRLVEGGLRVQVPNGFGAPVRRHRPAVLVRRGEWVRWRLNNRYSSGTGMSGWHYTLTTVSVAFGSVASEVFLGKPPHTVDEVARLR
jgi:hypothetical protein